MDTNYSQNQATQFLQEGPPNSFPGLTRISKFFAANFQTTRIVERWNGTQWDSLNRIDYLFDSLGCLVGNEQSGYTNPGWEVELIDLTYNTYDANGRITEQEFWFKYSLDTTIFPYYRYEYEYSVVGLTEEQTPQLSATLSPNPSSEIIRLKIDLPKASPLDFSIWSLDGKLLFQRSWKHQPGTSRQSFDPKLPEGTYFFRLESDFGSKTGKLIRLKP